MSTEQNTGARPSRRLHREDWLLHSLEALRQKGVSGLRVEPLARSLGVTTGSFYWHFRDRDDLLHAVIDHWADEMTGAVARRMGSTDAPGDQLRKLMLDITRENRSRYEISIRNWAAFDTYAAKAVRSVDDCRMAFVHGLFLQLGFDSDEAELRSRMLLCHQIGEAGLSIRVGLERRIEMAEARCAMLTQLAD